LDVEEVYPQIEAIDSGFREASRRVMECIARPLTSRSWIVEQYSFWKFD
jgi:hypothetical protein